MRYFLSMVMLAGILILPGCAAAANWQGALIVPGNSKMGEPIPLTYKVSENGKPVQGLVVKALLEMKRMDHGSQEVVLSEKDAGTYVGSVQLPMSGDWVATFEMSKEGNSQEQAVDFKIEEIGP